jgi:hypothetical protein
LELAPGFNPDHFILAWALFGLNRLDEAEKLAHEESIRDPKLALAHLLRVNIYIRPSDYSEAIIRKSWSNWMRISGSSRMGH